MRYYIKFMERSIDILERIAEFKIGLNNWEWTDYISGKPDKFDDMTYKEKDNQINNIVYKLDLMLKSIKNLIVTTNLSAFNGMEIGFVK